MRSALFALVLALSACGGESTVPIDTSFPLGPKQLRVAILDQFADVLAPGDTNWPASQPETTVELQVVKTAALSPGTKPAWAGHALELDLDPAWISVDFDAPGFDEVDLFIGPPGATDLADSKVHALAHGKVPATRRENDALTWTADGPALFAAALQGELDGQHGARDFTLLARARATVTLEPGAQLPGSDAAANVELEIPLRYEP